MALTYTIDPTLRLVRFVVGKSLPPSLADLQHVLDELAADSLFQRGFGVLINLWDYPVEPTLTRSALIKVAARATLFSATRWAQVTTNADVWYTRLTQERFARDHGLQYRVFRDETAAMSWGSVPSSGGKSCTPIHESASAWTLTRP